MLVWKDILQPVSVYLPKGSTLLEALTSFVESDFALLWVKDPERRIVGYLDRHSLLQQIKHVQDLHHPIDYKTDFIQVPAHTPISFFHNITVVLALEEDGTIAGFTTTKEAKSQLSKYKLQKLNDILNTSGIGLITTDSDFSITFMNEAAERIAGVPKHTMLYQNYRTMLDMEHDLEEVLTGKHLISVNSSLHVKPICGHFSPLFENEKIMGMVHLFTLREQLGRSVYDLRKTEESKVEPGEKINKKDASNKLIYRSTIMERLVDELKYVAKVDSTVLFMGESGVGKEVFAQTLHDFSLRKNEPFIRVNCGAIPENLMESEFFGYEKGAFTGADQKGKPGLFELAHKGTIFLDEVTELQYNMQVKLLRVLQEKEIMRVGGVRTTPVDIRVIAATNRNIRELVSQHKFREDLYYRLHVIPIEIPPLRKRTLDIVPLTIHFLQHFNHMYKLNKTITREALDILEGYAWPGNVRELHNVIERLVVTIRGDSITAQDVWEKLYRSDVQITEKKPMVQEIMPLKEAVEEVESQLISLALKKYGTAAKVAKILGVSPATVSRRLQKHLQ
ncbi:sigma-54 interaction domain-containing protein [Brevibacillus sp. H7]|uniref:sigma-54 interaction domain-containing protein n=1 Tax=Brevibacillus sp. H7 TaxID=3349138 RepID=UPI003817CB4A